MNQVSFYFVSIRDAVGGPAWERYFAYCPTVQDMRDTIKQEDGWTVLLELLSRLKGSTIGTYNITIEVAGTAVGYVIVTKLEAYTK